MGRCVDLAQNGFGKDRLRSIVLDEAAGVWIYNTKYFGPWAKSLEGIRFSPIGNGQELRWVYYAK